MITSTLGILSPGVASAFVNDFGGVPKESPGGGGGLNGNGMRGKSGALAAPSESGLGLFVDKDGASLLRLAVADVDVRAREVQANLELVKLRLDQVGFSGKTPIWNAALADAQRAEATLAKSKEAILAQVSSGDEAECRRVLDDTVVPLLGKLKETTKAQDYSGTAVAQRAAAEGMSSVRERMAGARVATSGPLSGKVPDEYKGLPRLDGRATVELTFASKSTPSPKRLVTVVVDGFHAPLASGAFVTQAASGAFDGVKVAYNEELIVGMKRPTKGSDKLVVPLELFYRGDTEPTYGVTQDDDGRGQDTQVLPFQAFGALGMSHPDEDIDGGKQGQFFFVKYDQGLLPPGRNTLDGAYTCFGYAVETASDVSNRAVTTPGKVVSGGSTGSGAGFEDAIKGLQAGDVLEKAVVVNGLGNLKQGV